MHNTFLLKKYPNNLQQNNIFNLQHKKSVLLTYYLLIYNTIIINHGTENCLKGCDTHISTDL